MTSYGYKTELKTLKECDGYQSLFIIDLLFGEKKKNSLYLALKLGAVGGYIFLAKIIMIF